MTAPRKPAAFRLEANLDEAPAPARPLQPARAPTESLRPPRVLEPERAIVVPAEIDVFSETDPTTGDPPPAVALRRRSVLATIFVGAFGILVSLAVGLWTDALIRSLFERADWLGWVAAGVAAIAGLSLAVILARELWALSRLASIDRIRRSALDAMARDDPRSARAVVGEIAALLESKPETANGRRAMADLRDEIIDGANLIRLAETEMLAPLDAKARILILDAAKRVSVVTAISPRALVDLAYVVFEASRLIRRLSELYGGRPGTLGFFRLARGVVAHLAVTGVIAAGDDFVHQVVGQGLAARLSAKLGEGVVNGMMTARIGIAAMETARPLPFTAVKRPGIGDFLIALTSFTARKRAAAGASKA